MLGLVCEHNVQGEQRPSIRPCGSGVAIGDVGFFVPKKNLWDSDWTARAMSEECRQVAVEVI